MKIAISTETNQGAESKIAHHFGRCPYFALAELNDENITSLELIDNPFFESHQPGQVPEFINNQSAKVMISGGMGRRALEFFAQYGINVKTGASGTVGTVIESYIAGDLKDGASCAHSESHDHGHHHHGEHGHHGHHENHN
jgi:predicted Fe-Mo cluster-binding NifX family protein